MSGLELPGLGPRVALELDPPFNRAHRDSAVVPLARAVGNRMWSLSGLFFGVDEALGLPRAAGSTGRRRASGSRTASRSTGSCSMDAVRLPELGEKVPLDDGPPVGDSLEASLGRGVWSALWMALDVGLGSPLRRMLAELRQAP